MNDKMLDMFSDLLNDMEPYFDEPEEDESNKPGITAENTPYISSRMQNSMMRLNPSFLTIGFCFSFSTYSPSLSGLAILT